MFGLKMPWQIRSARDRCAVAGASICAIECPAKTLRRIGYFSAVILSSCAGIYLMFDILSANGLTLLEGALLTLFSVTFAWIVVSFWSAAIGFVLQIFSIDPLSLKRSVAHRRRPLSSLTVEKRHALIMPIYNEETRRVVAGLEASLISLELTGQLEHFDVYLLSDTQKPEIIETEQKHWQGLLQRHPHLRHHLFYRRRDKNIGRKVGNLGDFCQRWGSYYEGMIVLDADSIMTGECILRLVHSLEANPAAGLIQTVPIPVRQRTFFGRYLQFAADLYSPMLAAGMAFWQTDSANYWGHNAIIRIEAFIANCGLPTLPGSGPFGGEILSHDFVEAALLRRGGWDVFLLAELQGSFEEVPSNLLDYATRDRRWVQGNIQHLALLRWAGLHGVSRLHFLFGAIAYLSTLVWLAMLGLSTVDAALRALSANTFFESGHQLFPTWPVAKTELIFSMLYVTAVLLLLPKLMGLVVALVHRRSAFGGSLRLMLGALVEAIFAVLIAPLMMVFHSYFVMCVFLGRKVSWNSQARDGRMVAWREAISHTVIATVIAIIWGAAALHFSPSFFWWLVPVLTGLVLAAPLVRFSSSFSLGDWMRRWGVFVSSAEAAPPPVLSELERCLSADLQECYEAPEHCFKLLPRRWRAMPTAQASA